jgi:hypothetical protein
MTAWRRRVEFCEVWLLLGGGGYFELFFGFPSPLSLAFSAAISAPSVPIIGAGRHLTTPCGLSERGCMRSTKLADAGRASAGHRHVPTIKGADGSVPILSSLSRAGSYRRRTARPRMERLFRNSQFAPSFEKADRDQRCPCRSVSTPRPD